MSYSDLSSERSVENEKSIQLYKIDDDTIYEGKFDSKRCVRTGRGKIWFLKEKAKYEGEIHNDMPNGKGRLVFLDGSIYEGYFKNGKAHGKGLFVNPDDCKYYGDWLNDI